MSLPKDQRRQEYHAPKILRHTQIKKFHKEIRDILTTLVNDHGVEYRLQRDGQHLHLYSGRKHDRPFKVAASRPVDAQLRFLLPWLKEHFPDIDIESGKKQAEPVAVGPHLYDPGGQQGDIVYCKVCRMLKGDERAEHVVEEVGGYPAEDVTGEPFRCRSCGRPELDCSKDPCEDVVKDREAEVEIPEPWKEETKIVSAKDGWETYVYPSGKVSECFEISTGGDTLEPRTLRCTKCPEYTRKGSFNGVHLHEATHTGKGAEMLTKGVETRKANEAARKEATFAAFTTLADQHGLVVLTKEDAKSLKNQRDVLAENERLRQELDEIKAKFALAKEAFGL